MWQKISWLIVLIKRSENISPQFKYTSNIKVHMDDMSRQEKTEKACENSLTIVFFQHYFSPP